MVGLDRWAGRVSKKGEEGAEEGQERGVALDRDAERSQRPWGRSGQDVAAEIE